MKAKLKVIKNWEFEEFELTGTSFKYSPTGCKGMVARSEDEIVFWTYHLVQKCSGVLWVKDEVSRWIPSPEPKEQQDVWEDPVLLSCDRGILLVCPASKSLWWMPQMDGEWIPIPMDNWCAQGCAAEERRYRILPPEAKAFSLLCAEWTTPLMRPTVLPA